LFSASPWFSFWVVRLRQSDLVENPDEQQRGR